MTATHADCFLALAEIGHPAGAALLCGTTPGALLRAIQRLEVELDGLLFTRRPGPPRLSPLGAAWLPVLAAAGATMPDRHRHDAVPALDAPPAAPPAFA